MGLVDHALLACPCHVRITQLTALIMAGALCPPWAPASWLPGQGVLLSLLQGPSSPSLDFLHQVRSRPGGKPCYQPDSPETPTPTADVRLWVSEQRAGHLPHLPSHPSSHQPPRRPRAGEQSDIAVKPSCISFDFNWNCLPRLDFKRQRY